MSPGLGALTMALVGAFLAQQAPINRGLARTAGPLAAAVVNFAIGGLFLLALCVSFGELDGLSRVGGDWWHALGGILGAVYVFTALIVVRRIGASGVAAGTISGQLLSSVTVDSTGALGAPQRPLDAIVALGAAAVIVGTLLVAEGRQPTGAPQPDRQILPLAAMVGAGVLVGVQIPLNGLLAESTGDLSSGLINFLVGGTALAFALVASGSVGGLAAVTRVRWFYLAGGVIGAVNALAGLALVGQIGAGTVAAATITGQMLASLLLDRLGVFSLRRRPLSAGRLLGSALLIGGTVMIAA